MSIALFLVKFVHSLVVLYMFGCLYVLWQYALTGWYRRWVGIAIGSIVLEGVVYAAWGWRCPLTDWAIALGDDTGADFIMELLLLDNVSIVVPFAIFFAVGVSLAAWRWWHTERYR